MQTISGFKRSFFVIRNTSFSGIINCHPIPNVSGITGLKHPLFQKYIATTQTKIIDFIKNVITYPKAD